MSYLSIEKVFHQNENKANELYLQRYNNENTIKTNLFSNDNFEFFFSIHNDIVKLIEDIYRLNNKIVMIQNKLSAQALTYFIQSSLIEEILSTNEIEGVYISKKEIESIMHTNENNKYQRLLSIVSSYIDLLDETVNDPINDVSEVRHLYDKILSSDINKDDLPDGNLFRKHGVHISSGFKTVHACIDGEDQIINFLNQSLHLLNNINYPLLIRISLFHFLFEYSHPFYDGNGRLGRYLCSYYLKNEFNILTVLQLSISISHNKNKYYKAFTNTSDIRNKGDLSLFVYSFLSIYKDGLEELIERIEKTLSIYKSILDKIQVHTDKEKSILIPLIEATLFASKGLSIDDLVENTKLSKQTIRHIVRDINIHNTIIEIDKAKKNYLYTYVLK